MYTGLLLGAFGTSLATASPARMVFTVALCAVRALLLLLLERGADKEARTVVRALRATAMTRWYCIRFVMLRHPVPDGRRLERDACCTCFGLRFGRNCMPRPRCIGSCGIALSGCAEACRTLCGRAQGLGPRARRWLSSSERRRGRRVP